MKQIHNTAKNIETPKPRRRESNSPLFPEHWSVALRTLSLIIAWAAPLALPIPVVHAQTNSIPNPLIDYDTFLVRAAEVGRLRIEHRVTEEKFIEMATDPDTVVFDARSDDKYLK